MSLLAQYRDRRDNRGDRRAGRRAALPETRNRSSSRRAFHRHDRHRSYSLLSFFAQKQGIGVLRPWTEAVKLVETN